MPLADDLLIQARMLATVDPGIPLQANLRRSISAAYYAVFHLLVAEAVEWTVPKRPAGLSARVARLFSHSEMDKVCRTFTNRQLPDRLAALLNNKVPIELRTVAEVFSELQDARHLADYDTGVDTTRTETLILLDRAQSAFDAWETLRGTEEASAFLTALAFGPWWSK